MNTTLSPQKPTAKNILKKINILLADDDEADCLLFKEALEELPLNTHLTMVYNGEQLMEELAKNGSKLPDVLFLDLNMPRKNGFASLGIIKRSEELLRLPVIIFTTASDMDTAKKVFRDAAHYYITKPSDFLQLKKVIYQAITLVTQKNARLPNEENFMITGDSVIIPDKK